MAWRPMVFSFVLLLGLFHAFGDAAKFTHPASLKTVYGNVTQNVTLLWTYDVGVDEPLSAMWCGFTKPGDDIQIMIYKFKREPATVYPVRRFPIEFIEDGVQRVAVAEKENKIGMTLLNLRKADERKYNCELSGDGIIYTPSVKVKLLVRDNPVVDHFSPNNASALEGDTVQFTCNATGPPNMTRFYYFFNGMHKLTSPSNLWVVRMGGCTTSSGNYSCQAENSYGNSTVMTYNLTVGGLPFIYLPPVPITGHESVSSALSCYAVGCPAPSVSWEKVDDLSFLSHGNVLVLGDMTRENAGTYRCIARNKHGKKGSDAIVTVNYSPTVDEKNITFSRCLGEKISLPCTADGVPVPSVRITDSLGNVVAASGVGSVSYESVVTDSHFGNYTCHASNLLGSDKNNISVSRHDTVSAPRNVTVVAGEPNTFVISWVTPACIPESLVASYKIYLKDPLTSVEFNITVACGDDSCQYTVSDLDAGVNYQVSVAAVDGLDQIGERSTPQSRLPAPAIDHKATPGSILIVVILIIVFIMFIVGSGLAFHKRITIRKMCQEPSTPSSRRAMDPLPVPSSGISIVQPRPREESNEDDLYEDIDRDLYLGARRSPTHSYTGIEKNLGANEITDENTSLNPTTITYDEDAREYDDEVSPGREDNGDVSAQDMAKSDYSSKSSDDDCLEMVPLARPVAC